jgi:DNA-binding MarR family transcriptional regulator
MKMSQDSVDLLLTQWARERPDLDLSGLAIVVRILAMSTGFRREAEKSLAAFDLQLWEYDVLSALRRQGARCELPATDLARETLLSGGAMTNRIDRLEETGQVKRRSDPKDRRSVWVTLTGAGRKTIDAAIKARFDLANRQVMSLTDRERKQLAQLLRKIVNQ